MTAMLASPLTTQFVRPRLRTALAVATAGVLFVIGIVSAASAGAASSSPRPFYAAARILWESEADVVSGALQNVPLVAAVHDLILGLKVAGTDPAGYQSAIATIRAFEAIPLTSETKTQMRDSRRDWAALNVFFDISPSQERVLDDDLRGGPFYNIAQDAFEKEPGDAHHGVNAHLLEVAATNLAEQASRPSTRAVLYTAAIIDLKQLERASMADVASSTSALLNPYVQDIYYLNAFFMTSRL
jgi:hypothetical protein